VAHPSQQEVDLAVKVALREDVGKGDLSAALVPAEARAIAIVTARESAVIAGQAWFNAVFQQLDESLKVVWMVKDGDYAAPNQELCRIEGLARPMLTGERTALNFLQTLSGTATQTMHFVERVKGTKAKILDTRKTLPGMRLAQKYAVTCGGGFNHRAGLYDAVMIKENHIAAAGSIAAAVDAARKLPGNPRVIVEAENLYQVEDALACHIDQILLDNLASHILARAVGMCTTYKNQNRNRELIVEASGNIDMKNIRDVADAGVDCISLGSLTKNVRAVDLSMRFSNA
jgi:nicotinate-nucleotide pyrophosphorylase (carboxylating)